MKARFFALAALVLGLASCQQDFNEPTMVGGEVDFQLSVGAGEVTRGLDADGKEGYDSAHGAIDYLNEADWAKYDLRYSLEVYDVADDYAGATPIKDRMVKIVDSYEAVTFDLRLVPNRDYHFVVFADFVPQNASDDANTVYQSELGVRHNIGANLGQITIKADAINDEVGDAYFATKDIKVTNSAAQDIVLRRPYGKVRVIATDLAELNLNVNPGKVEVEYESFHPAAFNAVTGEVDGKYETCTYACEYAEISKEEGGLQNHFYNIGYDAEKVENANGVKRHSHMTLFTDYILAEKEGQTPYHFTMTVWDQNGTTIKETHFSTDIPVERNMLTTVIGNVLTTATEINITIDDDFKTSYTLNVWDGKTVKEVAEKNGVYEIYEASELAWFAKQVNEGNKFSGKTVKLCKDIHLNGEVWTPIGATGKFEGTFDGQNHVIEDLFVNVTTKAAAGLFANAKYVENLKVCHANVNGYYKTAVIVGDGLCSRITNCHVENATVTVNALNEDDGNHVGAIVGYLSAENEAYVKNCSVKNAEIRGYRDVAAIAGTANQAAVVSGNSVENVTVIADQTVEYKEVKVANVDAIAGRVHAKATVENNTVGKNVEVYVMVNTAANLEYQANNSPANRDIKIVVVGNVEGNAVIKQREGVNVIVAGAEGNSYNGFITINGDARYDGAETLKFEGINFKSDKGMDFIYAPTKYDGRYNYSHNVTVDGCTFSSEAYNEEIVGIKLQTTYNAAIKNCKAENIHSLAQISSTDNEIVIENVKVVNCKNGLGLGNIAKAVISGAEISAKGYGIRLDGEKSRTVAATIENATINAYIPVNVRKMNDEACNVEVEFLGTNNVLAGSVYEIAFCSNEYENGVEPQNPVGTFRLQNAEEARAFYGTVTSFSAFDAAINSTNAPEVKVESDITKLGEGVEVERNVTIDFDNKVFNAGSTATSTWYALEIFGAYNVNIKNAKFTRAGVFAAENANVVFDSGIINHKPERTSRYIFCAQSGSTITVKGGVFTNDRAKNSFFWADAATIIVEGGNFGGVASNKKIVETEGGKVIIKAGTFNFDPSAWVVPGSVVTKNGNKWVVEVIPATAPSDFASAISNVENGGTIVLENGTYNMPSTGGKEITIVGSKDAVINLGATNTGAGNVTLYGVTVKAGQYKGFQHSNVVTYNDVTIEGELFCYGAKDIFNNCTFELNNGYVWTYGSQETVFDNCTFNTNGKAILVYNEGAGASNVTVKNCTFNATAGAKAGAIKNQNCAAIEIDNYQNSGVGVAHTVATSNNTYSDNFSGEWRIKNYVAGAAITVNGTEYNTIALDGKAMTIDADKNVTVL